MRSFFRVRGGSALCAAARKPLPSWRSNGSMSGPALHETVLGGGPPLEYSDSRRVGYCSAKKLTKAEGEEQPDLPPDQFGPVGMGFPSTSEFSGIVANDFVSSIGSVMREWWDAKELYEARWIPTDLLAFELLRRQIQEQPTHWRRKTAAEVGYIPWTPAVSQPRHGQRMRAPLASPY